MGWCSATEIMDTALQAAEAVAVKVAEMAVQVDEGRRDPDANPVPDLDEVLRPFVRAIAEQLRDGDWDCIEEAEHFARFPQEMLGFDDRQYLEHLNDQLKWTEPGEQNYPTLIRKVAALTARMESRANGAG